MDIIIVTAGIIINNERFLITQRKENSNQNLKWEFPGGKLEKGESPEEGLKREISEELGIEVKVGDVFEVVYHKYEDKTILLLCYICKYLSGQVRAIECNDFEWVSLNNITKYDLLEADVKIKEKILRKNLPVIW